MNPIQFGEITQKTFTVNNSLKSRFKKLPMTKRVELFAQGEFTVGEDAYWHWTDLKANEASNGERIEGNLSLMIRDNYSNVVGDIDFFISNPMDEEKATLTYYQPIERIFNPELAKKLKQDIEELKQAFIDEVQKAISEKHNII